MDSLFCKSECGVSQVALPQVLRARWTPEEDAIFQATFKENGGIQCQGVFELIAAKLTTKTLFQIKAHFGQNINTAKLLGRIKQYPIRVPLDKSEFNDTSSNGESKSGNRTVGYQNPTMSAKGQRWSNQEKEYVFLFFKIIYMLLLYSFLITCYYILNKLVA